MFTLECFFSEWFAEDDGTAWGRVPVSNDTAAVQRSMRWGGVRPQAAPALYPVVTAGAYNEKP